MQTRYLHHVPGRLRVRTSRIKNNPQAARAAEVLMLSVRGVEGATTNTLTGSLTVHYDDGATCLNELLPVLRAQEYIDEHTQLIRPTPALPGISGDVAVRLVARLAALAAEKALERTVVSLVAAAL